jgi:hypothetical protein
MADAIVLGVLAILDLGFLLYLRDRRKNRKRKERLEESLGVYVNRENGDPRPKRRRLLLKAMVG